MHTVPLPYFLPPLPLWPQGPERYPSGDVASIIEDEASSSKLHTSGEERDGEQRDNVAFLRAMSSRRRRRRSSLLQVRAPPLTSLRLPLV